MPRTRRRWGCTSGEHGGRLTWRRRPAAGEEFWRPLGLEARQQGRVVRDRDGVERVSRAGVRAGAGQKVRRSFFADVTAWCQSASTTAAAKATPSSTPPSLFSSTHSRKNGSRAHRRQWPVGRPSGCRATSGRQIHLLPHLNAAYKVQPHLLSSSRRAS